MLTIQFDINGFIIISNSITLVQSYTHTISIITTYGCNVCYDCERIVKFFSKYKLSKSNSYIKFIKVQYVLQSKIR